MVIVGAENEDYQLPFEDGDSYLVYTYTHVTDATQFAQLSIVLKIYRKRIDKKTYTSIAL